uniref:Uncharacterized protein n=2 Tax=Hyaloperonospora arabidopsidis (strain Emoy2) TaxID=559515 RepID=M4BHF0_HYAAE
MTGLGVGLRDRNANKLLTSRLPFLERKFLAIVQKVGHCSCGSADFGALKANAHVDESIKLASVSLSGSTDDVSNEKVNGSRHDLNGSSRIMSDEGDAHASEISTLQNQVKALKAQLRDAADENQHLQSTVKRLKQENARLQAPATFHSSADICEDDSGSTALKQNQELDINDNSDDQNSNMACTSTAIFGEVSAFQLVMVKDMKVLRNHERCQHKLHELWGTIWKLKAFVEAYAIERDVMKLQRDDALVEAERADNANVKLAGSGNLQQKIKYLEQLKNDNRTLCRKNRALNMRNVKQRADLVRVKSGCLPIVDDVPTIDTTDSASLDDLLHELDEPIVRNDEEILRSMREFSRFLEQRLVRLHLAKRKLLTSDDGSIEVSKLEGDTVIGELVAMPNAR